jgi:hypothetical protein
MTPNFLSEPSTLLQKILFFFSVALGLLMVLVGYWLEWKSDKGWYSNLNDFRACKSKLKCGKKLVMCGVIVEIIIALWVAKDAWDTRQTALKNDLHKQPIFALSGYAMVLVRPLEKADFESEKLDEIDEPPSLFRIRYPSPIEGNARSVTLMLGRAFEMANSTGVNEAFISSDNVSESISTFGGEKLLRFDMYFGENQNSFSNGSLTPEELDAIDLLLPIRGEIVGGQMEMSLDHDFIKRVFQIPKQPPFGESATSVATNGTFVPLDWSPTIHRDYEKSEKIRIKQSESESNFLARGIELESKANGGKKERTILDEQINLFINLLKDYPKTPIKVFVNSNDDEAVGYAEKIRELLDAAKYGGEAAGIIKSSNILLTGTNGVPLQPASNMLAFAAVPNVKNGGLFIPQNPIFYTNSPAFYAVGILNQVKWAFSGIGIGGFIFTDNTNLTAGEAGIIVLPRPK